MPANHDRRTVWLTNHGTEPAEAINLRIHGKKDALPCLHQPATAPSSQTEAARRQLVIENPPASLPIKTNALTTSTHQANMPAMDNIPENALDRLWLRHVPNRVDTAAPRHCER